MLLARCFMLSSTVLQAQLLLYQTEPFQFVDIGHTARIVCLSTETISSGIFFSWHKRRDNGISVLPEECGDGSNTNHLSSTAKFVCRVEQQRLILEISHAEREDSGLYLCAMKDLSFSFSNGSSLIVGDSYTPSTWVMLLLPPPHLTHTGRVACVVHGVSNLVQVSWEVPGELRQEGLMWMVRNSSGLLTYVSVLQIPRDPQWGGKNVTCEVQLNSSGLTVKEMAIFPARFQTKADEAPSSEVLEEAICYAELDFPSQPRDRSKKRKQEPRGKI
ncbi:uncharacterized protein LOC132588914 isoform X2 [Heteronotia binoei]|uniref:uncharacterized protein LOC132588914 isoform X2 n=1 Tax=Heteronotia binoei TaxID=13085 RepID=UPI00292D0756|nr:uncharacterized protein LOC132588914 isoform X2 [Heteronotia binoei]